MQGWLKPGCTVDLNICSIFGSAWLHRNKTSEWSEAKADSMMLEIILSRALGRKKIRKLKKMQIRLRA